MNKKVFLLAQVFFFLKRKSVMKVISIIGEKKSGKTSLIEYLIAYLKEYGKVGCIKHAHELDLGLDASKDTARFFSAGAEVVMSQTQCFV